MRAFKLGVLSLEERAQVCGAGRGGWGWGCNTLNSRVSILANVGGLCACDLAAAIRRACLLLCVPAHLLPLGLGREAPQGGADRASARPALVPSLGAQAAGPSPVVGPLRRVHCCRSAPAAHLHAPVPLVTLAAAAHGEASKASAEELQPPTSAQPPAPLTAPTTCT